MDWTLLLLNLAVCVIAMVVTAVAAAVAGRVSVVDITWGLAFAVIACLDALLGDGDVWRRVVIAVLVVAWGLRLGIHIWRRSRGHGEDPRYAALLTRGGADGGLLVAIRRVYLIQGLAIWLVSIPVLAGMTVATVGGPFGVVVVGVGALVVLIGIYFEAVGDAQLAAYKALPRAARPEVLDTGLWGLTRHPNYFGDACVWWGLWLMAGAASGWLPGVLTVVAPIAMTYFLVYATGARLLEQTMMQRAGYAEYAERVPMFIPRLRPGRL